MANNIANLKAEVGVVRDANADITSIPAVSDISVPTNYALVKNASNSGPTNKRAEHNPANRTAAQKGIGVPYNPVDGVTTD